MTAQRPQRKTGITTALIAAAIASITSWGGTMAVLKNNNQEHERRIESLEVEMKDARVTLKGVETNVEWLVKALGGNPAHKNGE